jgi:catechol 2,3-dioxygenase-like lactoylglutathione lyase family enzyme
MMRIRFKRLDHVQVCFPPGEEARAREFYGGLLGLEEIEKPEPLRARGGMWFGIADVQLHLGVEAPDAAPSPKRHPAFEVEGIGEVRAYLESSGVPVRDEPAVAGVERFSFFDPFGNRFELMEKVKS